MILYNLRQSSHGFLLAKFDEDFNVEVVYELTPTEANPLVYNCTCPAGPRPTCKHRKMLPRMAPKVDTDEFYCYETQTWHKPLAPAWVEEPIETIKKAFAEHGGATGVDVPVAKSTCTCASMDECDEREGCQVKAASGFAIEPSPLPLVATQPQAVRRRV